jgi:hypothetical protein
MGLSNEEQSNLVHSKSSLLLCYSIFPFELNSSER